jgi:hypothetical protein
VTTNQWVLAWGAVFGDEVLATAILDRLLHHSHTLVIAGESYRLREEDKSRDGNDGFAGFADVRDGKRSSPDSSS